MRRLSLLLSTIVLPVTFFFALGVSVLPVNAAGATVSGDTVIVNGISIGDTDVSGMTVTEASGIITDKVNKAKNSVITVYLVDNESEELSLADIDLKWLNTDVVREAASYANSGNIIKRYKDRKDIERDGIRIPIKYSVSKSAIEQFVTERCIQYNREAVDATLERTDDGFNVIPGVQGAVIDEKAAVDYLTGFITEEWSGRACELELPIITDEPKGTEEELSQVKDLLGTYSTFFKNSNAERAANIINGCKLASGVTVYPGEEYSVYENIRPFSEDNGYKMAGSYLNGVVVDSLGGGICQVSTTLYNAVIRAELDVTERHNHGMTVSYVPVSQDAAIAESSGMDMRFVNNTDYPVYVEGVITEDREIRFNIYGKETRPEGRSLDFETNILETIEPEGERVVGSSDKPVGFYSTQGVHVGYKAELIKIVKQDGKEVSREVINRSTYKATPRTALIGTASDDPAAVAAIKEAIDTGSIDYAVGVAAGYALQAAVMAAEAVGAP